MCIDAFGLLKLVPDDIDDKDLFEVLKISDLSAEQADLFLQILLRTCDNRDNERQDF